MDLVQTVKPRVVVPNVHGGIDFEELNRLGIRSEDVIDFSSNVLPNGPSPSVVRAIRSADFARYPDRECLELRRVIADRYGVSSEDIIVGNGCCELIQSVAMAGIRPGDLVIVVGPTFSEYERASRIAGGEVIRCNANADNDFAFPVEQIEQMLTSRSVRLVWICNPNNPTGQSISREVMLNWIASYPQTRFVVDEAYIEFSRKTESLIHSEALNLIVLRSMTKAFAIAGLRLGYAVIRGALRTEVQNRCIPWSVNTLAQVAGVVALQDFEYYEAAMQRLDEAKGLLLRQLSEDGFEVIPSETAFFLLRAADAPSLRQRLLKRGILIRDCKSFGLNEFVRIAVGTKEQNAVLIAGLSNRPAKSTLRRSSTWDHTFCDQLRHLFKLRRDVRRFRSDPLAAGTMRRLLEAACMAPSVGLSQPWRFVSVKSVTCREAVIAEFESENELAAAKYDNETQAAYRKLKLAGLREAPEHLTIFLERNTETGRGLGRATMPESVAYSVVASIQNFWLAARAEGIGVGWVSILRPERLSSILDIDERWQLIAYLCVGFPLEGHESVPALELAGWETRRSLEQDWIER